MGLRLRFVDGVDPRLKPEIVYLGKWLRRCYSFHSTLEIRLVNARTLTDFDGTKCTLRYWQSSRGAEPVIAEIAAGSFPQNLRTCGPGVAYPTVAAAVGRSVKYYFQIVRGSPLREDYATLWGDKLLDAYIDGSVPPPPWKGA